MWRRSPSPAQSCSHASRPATGNLITPLRSPLFLAHRYAPDSPRAREIRVRRLQHWILIAMPQLSPHRRVAPLFAVFLLDRTLHPVLVFLLLHAIQPLGRQRNEWACWLSLTRKSPAGKRLIIPSARKISNCRCQFETPSGNWQSEIGNFVHSPSISRTRL